MTNGVKTFLITSIVAVVIIIVGVILIKSDKTPKQKEQSATNDSGLVGKPLPNIRLNDKDGEPYPLESLKGKNVVLFFSEGLPCYPACWNQIAAFGNDQRFANADTIALSVVVDSPKDWQKAIEKMPELAKAIILFDTGATASQRLGILTEDSSMHAGELPGHTYVMLDKQGIVKEVFDDPKMGINDDLIMKKMLEFQS